VDKMGKKVGAMQGNSQVMGVSFFAWLIGSYGGILVSLTLV